MKVPKRFIYLTKKTFQGLEFDFPKVSLENRVNIIQNMGGGGVLFVRCWHLL